MGSLIHRWCIGRRKITEWWYPNEIMEYKFCSNYRNQYSWGWNIAYCKIDISCEIELWASISKWFGLSQHEMTNWCSYKGGPYLSTITWDTSITLGDWKRDCKTHSWCNYTVGCENDFISCSRRFRTAVPHLRYPHLKGTYYVDTLFMNKTSVWGSTCANVIGNGLGFTKFWPMVSKADSYESLWHFVQHVGIMEQLVTDGHPQWLTKNGKTQYENIG